MHCIVLWMLDSVPLSKSPHTLSLHDEVFRIAGPMWGKSIEQVDPLIMNQ